jgi:hypothetical protein
VCCFYRVYEDLTHNTRYVFGNVYGCHQGFRNFCSSLRKFYTIFLPDAQLFRNLQVQANVNGVDSPRQNVVVGCMWVHEGSIVIVETRRLNLHYHANNAQMKMEWPALGGPRMG